MNNDLMRKLQTAYADAQKAQEQTLACDAIKMAIRDIEKDRGKVEFKNILIARGLGIVSGVIILGMLSSTLIPIIYGIENIEDMTAWLPPIACILMLLVSVICGIFIAKILNKALDGSNLKSFNDKIAERQAELNQAQAVYNNLFSQCKAKSPFIPPKYLNTATIQKLYDILQYGRADSWKEALNVLEMDMRNKEMQEQMRRNAITQEQMLQSIKNAEFQAQRTADMLQLQNLLGNNDNNNNF